MEQLLDSRQALMGYCQATVRGDITKKLGKQMQHMHDSSAALGEWSMF
jgi:hypothetical protein